MQTTDNTTRANRQPAPGRAQLRAMRAAGIAVWFLSLALVANAQEPQDPTVIEASGPRLSGGVLLGVMPYSIYEGEHASTGPGDSYALESGIGSWIGAYLLYDMTPISLVGDLSVVTRAPNERETIGGNEAVWRHHLTYLSFSSLVRWHPFSSVGSGPFLGAGASIGWRFTYTVDGFDSGGRVQENSEYFDEAIGSRDVNAGVVASLGAVIPLESNRVTVEARYTLGLSDAYGTPPADRLRNDRFRTADLVAILGISF